MHMHMHMWIESGLSCGERRMALYGRTSGRFTGAECVFGKACLGDWFIMRGVPFIFSRRGLRKVGVEG